MGLHLANNFSLVNRLQNCTRGINSQSTRQADVNQPASYSHPEQGYLKCWQYTRILPQAELHHRKILEIMIVQARPKCLAQSSHQQNTHAKSQDHCRQRWCFAYTSLHPTLTGKQLYKKMKPTIYQNIELIHKQIRWNSEFPC